MTFNDLLCALRAHKPIMYQNTPETEGLDDSDELIFRLQQSHSDVSREWSNIDLIQILVSSNRNMYKEIPCRHCGSSKTDHR